ncbi:MAG: FixH family protein [Sphingobacteriaceae bacterium]|nr:FixH family protein [Sphingobacteriaceae bacterium]
MSWGIRITVLYMSFVVLILTLVFITTKNKEELESKDYYKQELAYQSKIDAITNANSLSSPINYQVSGKVVSINIPAELQTKDFTGEIYFFRPSDASKDINLKFKMDGSGQVNITDSKLVSGVYKMKITVNSNGKKYIKEELINMN